MSILVFPPFYFYHFWDITCLLIKNLHMNILLKHMNIPITCLYMWWLDTLNLGETYVLNLSLTSYEPNRDICSAIGLTTRPLSSVMSWAYCVSLVWYVRHMPCLNVYLESHACYEELFKTYLLLCTYQTCILAFAFALNFILTCYRWMLTMHGI